MTQDEGWKAEAVADAMRGGDTHGLSLRDVLRARKAQRDRIPDSELYEWLRARYAFVVNPGTGGALVLDLTGGAIVWRVEADGPRSALDWLDANTPGNRHRGSDRYFLHARRGDAYFVIAFGENLREAIHGAKALWED